MNASKAKADSHTDIKAVFPGPEAGGITLYIQRMPGNSIFTVTREEGGDESRPYALVTYAWDTVHDAVLRAARGLGIAAHPASITIAY